MAEVVEKDTARGKQKEGPTSTKHMRWNVAEVTALIATYMKYSEIPN
jgi:hypothetical protein